MKLNLSNIKFKGKRLDGDEEYVTGDLVRKLSRFGGQHHYIYVDSWDLEEEGVYHKVDASTVELVQPKFIYL